MKPIILFLLAFFSISSFSQILVTRDTLLMGSKFQISVVDDKETNAHSKINLAIAEIVRLEEMLSTYKSTSEVSLINQNAGIQPVKVSEELIFLTKIANHFSELTNGAFDISIASMDKIWRFDGTMDTLPTSQEIEFAKRNVNFKNIIIDSKNQTIFLKNKGMKITFDSIGKSFAADNALAILKNLGVQSAMVNAAGDITVMGNPPHQKTWNIGVQHPEKKNQIKKIVRLNSGAVTTSGDYQKYAYINGTRYSHIIDARTGYPTRLWKSITNVGENATICNALSTSCMLLTKKEQKQLLKKVKGFRIIR